MTSSFHLTNQDLTLWCGGDVNADWGQDVAKNWPPRARHLPPPEYSPSRGGTPVETDTGEAEGNDSGIVTGSEDPANNADDTISEAEVYTEEYTEDDTESNMDAEPPTDEEFLPASSAPKGKNKPPPPRLGPYAIKRAPPNRTRRRRSPYPRGSTTAPKTRTRTKNPNSTRLRTRGRIVREDIPPDLQDKISSLQEEIAERKDYIRRYGGGSGSGGASHARTVAPGPSSWRVDRFGQLKMVTTQSDWLICEDQLLYALRQELSDAGLGPMPHEQVRDVSFLCTQCEWGWFC